MRSIFRRWFVLLVVVVGSTAVYAYDQSAVDDDKTPVSATTRASLLNDWVIECVDCPHSFPEISPHSAAIDSDGVIHVVYGGDGLFHLTYRSGEWTIETVEGAGNDLRPPVMAVDGNGEVHALYARGEAGGLTYARQTAGGWELIPLPFFTGAQAVYSLAVDDSGTAHISYYDSFRGRLIYAHSQGDAWVVTTLDATWHAGVTQALTLDPDGRPAICYKVENGILRIAHSTAIGWQFEDIPEAGADGQACDLAFDPDGTLHVAHISWSGLPYSVLYSVRGPGGWSTEVVAEDAPSPTLQRYTLSLQLDADGVAHLAYNTLEHQAASFPNYTISSQRYATRGPDGWHVATLDDDNARDGSLVLDKGVPAVVYRGATGLSLAVPSDGGWGLTKLDRAGDVGYGSAIALHGFEMRVTYFDRENFAVFYAARSSTGWAAEIVDQQPAGRFTTDFTGLALGPGGDPRVIYDFLSENYFDQLGNIDYARRVGSAWSFAELKSWGFEPYAVAVDQVGQTHFAMQGEAGRLVYTPWPAVPPYEVVDAKVSGSRMTMIVDRDGRIHLAYAFPEGVRYAVRTDGKWTAETVYTGDEAADYVSLALDSKGQPHVAFYAGGLYHAERDGPNGLWVTTAIAPFPTSGKYASIAIDNRDRVHISYYEESEADLWYALRSEPDGGWAGMAVTSDSQVGTDSALALDPFGNPAIVYRNEDTGDLMVAYIPYEPSAAIFLPIVQE